MLPCNLCYTLLLFACSKGFDRPPNSNSYSDHNNNNNNNNNKNNNNNNNNNNKQAVALDRRDVIEALLDSGADPEVRR